MFAPLVVAESATREWLLLRFSTIMTKRIIRPVGVRVLSNCELMQLWTPQTIDGLGPWAVGLGPTASNTVLLPIPIEITELVPRAAKNA